MVETEDIVHLGVYSKEAMRLLKLYAGDECNEGGTETFIRASDNEILYRNTSKDNPVTAIQTIIDSLAYYSVNSSDLSRIMMLIKILLGDRKLTKTEEKLVGHPLNPFDTAAIETLEAERKQYEEKFSEQIRLLEAEKAKKDRELLKQIGEIRSKGI